MPRKMDKLSLLIGQNPRSWHELLPQVLWTYNTTCRTSIGVSLYTLTYGHDVVLPMEIVIPTFKTTFQLGLTPDEFNEAMMLELKVMEETRLRTLDILKVHKQRVAKVYNEIVKFRTFSQGYLV